VPPGDDWSKLSDKVSQDAIGASFGFGSARRPPDGPQTPADSGGVSSTDDETDDEGESERRSSASIVTGQTAVIRLHQADAVE
jgi:hypothetical protein